MELKHMFLNCQIIEIEDVDYILITELGENFLFV